MGWTMEQVRRIEEIIAHPEALAPVLDGQFLLGFWARSSLGPRSYGWVVVGTLRASGVVVREIGRVL